MDIVRKGDNMHPIDELAFISAVMLGVLLAIGTLHTLWSSWREIKAEDEFWKGWLLRERPDGKVMMNPDYLDNHRVYRLLGNYKKK